MSASLRTSPRHGAAAHQPWVPPFDGVPPRRLDLLVVGSLVGIPLPHRVPHDADVEVVVATGGLTDSALALSSIAVPSFAASPYYDSMGMPMTADQADMTYNGMMHPEMMDAQPRMGGQFRCSPEERRTRLQRKACGATKGVY